MADGPVAGSTATAAGGVEFGKSASSVGKKRKQRWGEAASLEGSGGERKRASRFSSVPPALDGKAKAEALRESISARLAALKQKAPPSVSSSATERPLEEASATTKKAKTYDFDMTTTTPLARQQLNNKKAANPYLAHAAAELDDEEDGMTDERIKGGRVEKRRSRHKPLTFVDPGTFIQLAESRRQKAWNAQQSGFHSGRKPGIYVQPLGMSTPIVDDYYTGKLDEALPSRPDADHTALMPHIMEWWDVELLPLKLRKQVATTEGHRILAANKLTKTTDATHNHHQLDLDDDMVQLADKCYSVAGLFHSKTAHLIQHPLPLHANESNDGQNASKTVVHLTKKERKRQRKLRRAEKQRQLQDMQAAGLVPPPEPRLTLSNFIKVLGDQAILDPSKMEQKVLSQIRARKLQHDQMNLQRKLHAASIRKQQQQQPSSLSSNNNNTSNTTVTVALFVVKDVSHPYHRTKLDLNAQQNHITGVVLECIERELSILIIEGGPREIKRYTRLLMARMKWRGELNPNTTDNEDEDEDDMEEENATTHKFNSNNTCEHVWTGLAPKRMFTSFLFQSCATSIVARKILETKGIAHFWDRAILHTTNNDNNNTTTFHFTLGNNNNNDDNSDKEEDIVMNDNGSSSNDG